MPETSGNTPTYESTALETALPASAYLDRDYYTAERDAIFHHDWLCVARMEQIPNVGDYLHVDAANERVLLIRNTQGQIGAFFNVCSHRGAELISTEPTLNGDWRQTGNFDGRVRCPYHAWTYELDGRLRGAPHITFSDTLPKSEFSLREIPLETWGGFVFINIAGANGAPTAPLAEQLGPNRQRIANYPLEDMRIGHRIAYSVNANWKLIAENYNECYHCGPVHPELCEIVPLFRKAGGAHLDWADGIPHRDGAWTFTRTGTTSRKPFPGLSEKEHDHHKGELFYPNLMLSLAADHVAAFTLMPTSEATTRIACDFLFHKDEIELEGFDHADASSFWDVVNRQDWAICESVQRGLASKGFRGARYAPMEDESMDIRRYLESRMPS